MFRKPVLITLIIVTTLVIWLSGSTVIQRSVVAQDMSGDITFDFTFYEGNPVLPRGEAGEWDSESVLAGCVIHHDDMFYMFYAGSSQVTAGSAMSRSEIGLATSEDGLTWTKYEGNPILDYDAVGGVWPGPCMIEDDGWIMYVTPRTTEMDYPGLTMVRVVASGPTGPWTVDGEIIASAPEGWDCWIAASSISRVNDEYVLYYFGMDDNNIAGYAIGRATSLDGVTFLKYDDPATTDTLYGEADPVFVHSSHGAWDSRIMMVSTLRTESGWEMFYTGIHGTWRTDPAHIGYSTSADGITWERYGDAPILSLEEEDVGMWWPSAVIVDDTYYVYFNILPVNHEYMEIGIAIGTITRGEMNE